MYAIATSMPRTAPAKSLVAGGMRLSAVLADMPAGATLNAGNWPEFSEFRYQGPAMGTDSHDATVM
jgi:hypothetical protein